MACRVNNNINTSVIELIAAEGFDGLGEATAIPAVGFKRY